jgi:serine/threonine protein kinase/Tol biopolymer transport system component
MLRAGDQIGPYTLISKLGRGAFGTVWLSERRSTIVTTTAALKIPLDDDIELETVRQEAALWVRASGHPNVLPIIEANIYDEQIVIASEYAPDGSLDSWLRQQGGRAPSVESAVEIMLGVLAGLEHLHKREIIHRDLKPANILFQGITPRLSDFGISRVLKSTSQSSMVAGTPSYMAPEAFSGKRSEQTDVWAVGVLLYQLLAGALPFPQDDPPSLMYAILSQEPEALPVSIPEKLRLIVSKTLQKDPEQRYQSATEMRRALRQFEQSLTKPVRSGPLTLPVVGTTPASPRASAPQATLAVVPPLATMPGDLPTQLLTEPSRNKSKLVLLGAGGLATFLFISAGLALGTYLIWFRTGPVAKVAGLSPPVTSPRTTPSATSGTWTLDRTLNSDKGGPGSVTFSPDSKTMACVWNYVGTPTVKLIDVQTGTVKHILASQSDWVNSMHFSPDGTLVVGTADKGFRVWDAATGDVKQTVTSDAKVYDLSFSPDGAVLASVGEDKRIVFWDTKSWERKRSFGEGTYVDDIVFSPDGKLIASGPRIRIWDVATGELKQTLLAREIDYAYSIVFSPDGKLLANGNREQSANLWDVGTGKLVRSFTDFKDSVDSVDFSPEGKQLAMRSREGALKIYDVQTGELIQSLSDVYEDHPSGSDHTEFSPDGRWLASGDGHVSFKLWKRH